MHRTELLFPHAAVRYLRNARGPKWKKLVEHVSTLAETHPDAMALQLMMIRMSGCVTCDARKYAERGGCVRSSLSALALSKETDDDLLERFRNSRKEVLKYMKERDQDRALQAA